MEDELSSNNGYWDKIEAYIKTPEYQESVKRMKDTEFTPEEIKEFTDPYNENNMPYLQSMIDGSAFKNPPVYNEENGTYTWTIRENKNKYETLEQILSDIEKGMSRKSMIEKLKETIAQGKYIQIDGTK